MKIITMEAYPQSSSAIVSISIRRRHPRNLQNFSPTSPPLKDLECFTDFSKMIVGHQGIARTTVDIKENILGMKGSNVKVQIEDDNVLTIRGKEKREEVEEDTKHIHLERKSKKYLRKFVLPLDADLDSISTVYQDNILTVTVPKCLLSLRSQK
eukprot:Gb_18132 [translate_table: standard]